MVGVQLNAEPESSAAPIWFSVVLPALVTVYVMPIRSPTDGAVGVALCRTAAPATVRCGTRASVTVTSSESATGPVEPVAETSTLPATEPASTSDWLSACVAVHCVLLLTARVLAAHVTAPAVEVVTVTALSGWFPVLVTVHVQVITSAACGDVPAFGGVVLMATAATDVSTATVRLIVESTKRCVTGSVTR